jgi:serine/threonine protein phosphatase PrpC
MHQMNGSSGTWSSSGGNKPKPRLGFAAQQQKNYNIRGDEQQQGQSQSSSGQGPSRFDMQRSNFGRSLLGGFSSDPTKNSNDEKEATSDMPPLKIPSIGRNKVGGSNSHIQNGMSSSPRGQAVHNNTQLRDLVGTNKKGYRSSRHSNSSSHRYRQTRVTEDSTSNSINENTKSSGESQLNLPQIGSNGGHSQKHSSLQKQQLQQQQLQQHQVQQQQLQQQNPNVDRATLPFFTEDQNFASVASVKGLKPGNPNWINQDNFFVIERLDNKDLHFYCVLDGHGEHGHHVSRKCRENFPAHIKSVNFDMKKAFSMMQNDLNSCEYDVRCSGATCVLASLFGGRLSVSNCGDSRGVLGRRNPNGSISAHALTSDHKPEKSEERKRILGCGGHLGCRQVLVNQPGRGPVSMPVGPCRVWYQHRGETLGLAMSRSLGDSIVHKSGVSAEPEILEHQVDDFDEFMIIATDGVWDVMDNNQAVQMVSNFITKAANWSSLEASTAIAKFARSRWEKLSPMADDITCVVVKLRGRS